MLTVFVLYVEETIKALKGKLDSYEHLIQCRTKDEDEEEECSTHCVGEERSVTYNSKIYKCMA